MKVIDQHILNHGNINSVKHKKNQCQVIFMLWIKIKKIYQNLVIILKEYHKINNSNNSNNRNKLSNLSKIIMRNRH